jgi:hypothetical protein
MRRRQLLAGGAALLSVPLAGCGHPPNVLDMSEATDQRIADEKSRTVSTESDKYGLARSIAENGSATASGLSPPLDTDNTIAVDGEYYNLSVTETDSGQRTRYDIRIDYDPGDVTPGDGEIAYADLPAVDREALGHLVPPPSDRDTDEGFEMGRVYSYPENATEESVLVPDQQYDLITYEGEQYLVRVDAESVTEADYRYNGTLVADSTAAFADIVRSRYLFTLSGLSEAEREVVQTAIEDGYFEEETDAFRSVIARFLAHRALNERSADDGYGTWIVAYDGTEYVTYAEYSPNITPMDSP